MASAGFSSYSTTPPTSLEQLNIPPSAVRCATKNAVNKMQTTAELLLLQSDDKSFTIQPLFNTDTDHKACKEAVVKNAKGLTGTIRQMNHQLRQKQCGMLSKSLEVLGDQVMTVTEATAHLAYSKTTESVKQDTHHSFNRYLLVKCELDIAAACERLQFEYGQISGEELTQMSSGISDNVASIKRICLEEKDLPSEDKTEIALLGDVISAAFVIFINCLKNFMSNPHSSECRQKCLILSKPLLVSIGSLTQITDSTIFGNLPVKVPKKSSDSMTALLGSAMAIVSSSVRYVESIQSVMEDMDDNSSWKSLVKCSKSVAESAKLLATTLRQATPVASPFASKRNSLNDENV